MSLQLARVRLRWLAVTVVVGLVASVTAAPPASAALVPEPGASGIGDEYFPLDGNGGYDVQRYVIHNSYTFGNRRLSGWTRIRLTATQDLSRLNFDFLLPVSSVRVNGVAATVQRPVRHELQVTPATPILTGETVSVVVRYAGFPSRLRYNGESNWLANRREVVTINEPHMAPWWFPANDHPRDKASFAFHITVPGDNVVVANGRPAGHERRNGRTTWHWRAKDPMVPYLAFFAAGDFAIERGRADGRPWLLAVSRQLPRQFQRSSMRMLRRTPAVVRWLSRELGPYPFEATGGLVTGLGSGFALENQTRPVYQTLFASDTWLLVHELGHQWFGDHVAVRNWRDIWLNEGFATYLEQRYAEAHGGPTAARWLRREYNQIPAASGFWDLAIGDPGPDSLFDYPVYLRGGMTLQALRNRIGNADFRKVLRRWVRQQGGGDAATEDFQALAERVSGADLDGFFDAWLSDHSKPADTTANGLAVPGPVSPRGHAGAAPTGR